jgi:type II restriction/modification system DNA methylase subunit YeeA
MPAGHPYPAAADQSGESFTFEKHVSTVEGDKGFADVWKRGYFAWEYKGKHKDLLAAYLQLLRFREDLENPPLLVVCDQDHFEVHTNFPNTKKQVYSFRLDDLLSDAPTPNCALPPLEVLRALFNSPDELRPDTSSARVTEKAATEFAKLATNLEVRKIDPEKAAHFLMRLLFCLFADSIGLLPDHLFRKMIEIDKGRPANFNRKLRQLFAAMAKGDIFGVYDVSWFNGALFADDAIIELAASDLAILTASASLDWSYVEPAIFGTLFERSFDPTKRSQLGAHYTSKPDILTIIDPVLVAPLQQRWEEVRKQATALADAAAKEAKGPGYSKLRKQLQELVFGWVEELSKVRVLDPACGSGNFLYLALKRMLDLWKEAYVFSAEHGLRTFLPYQVDPSQLYGLETNVYAHEPASVVVWIGYLQWLKDNGIGMPKEPILRHLTNIQHRDAILGFDAKGNPVEPEWPEAEFIVGNPPFLGDKKMRAELGDDYVDSLRALYVERVPGGADLVTFWFERARRQIETGQAKRAGLLATNSISMPGNRPVLEAIKKTGDIFMAWGDRPWVLDGANVRVAMVGFDNGSEKSKTLDGHPVTSINADLTSGLDATAAKPLPENQRLCFLGMMKAGPFDISKDAANEMLNAPLNPNGRPNSDVVKRRLGGQDVTGRPSGDWIIDFGCDMPEAEAALYEKPFEYVKEFVKPLRDANRRERTRRRWWIHGEARPGLRGAIAKLSRCIVTPEVAKHRLFVWMPTDVIPDHKLHVIARDDDYFLGVLHSRIHELWALHLCSTLGVCREYVSTSLALRLEIH